MMLYILQSNRNCQVAFSLTVIQIYLCRLKSRTLIEEMIFYFFSCFQISQVEEGIIIQFAYTQHHFKTCPCEGKAGLSLTLYYKKKSSIQELKRFTGSQGGLVIGKSAGNCQQDLRTPDWRITDIFWYMMLATSERRWLANLYF